MNLEFINSREFAKRVVNYRTDRLIQEELQKIHYDLFKVNFRVNCGSCIKQAYVNIREKINEVTTVKKQIQMNKFELKSSSTGISKQIHMDNDVYTNDNLTDEIAIIILKKAPSHIATFAKYPENWRDLVSGKVAKVEEQLVDSIKETTVQPSIISFNKTKKGKK